MIICSCLRAACQSCTSCGDGIGYSMAQIWEILLRANPGLSPHNPHHHLPLKVAYIELTNTLFNRRHERELTDDDRCGNCFGSYLKWYARHHPLPAQPQPKELTDVL